MWYKRFWFAMVLVLAFGMLAAALAEEPVDPRRQEMMEYLQLTRRLEEEKTSSGNMGPEDDSGSMPRLGYGSIITISGTLKPEQTLTFRANTGRADNSSLVFNWGIQDYGRDSGGYLYYPQYDDCTGKTSISYPFYSPGYYKCMVTVYTADGTYVGYDYIYFTIEDDGVHSTLEEKAQSIVTSCRGSTPWQTALNLYDWLTHNAYYDPTYETHGADILFLGKGVCDSYSKAYSLLCQTAGITVERAISNTHAWNTIQLGGEWYQVDATWDDPIGETVAVSGYEGHHYFCLNSEIMQSISSHELKSSAHGLQCTSLEQNYYIHENRWQTWKSGRYAAKAIVGLVTDAFSQGETVWEGVLNNIYDPAEGGYVSTKRLIEQRILAWALCNSEIPFTDEDAVRVTAAYDMTGSSLQVRLKEWALEYNGMLSLPASLGEVSESMLEGTAVMKAVIPAGCSAIQSRAFAGSALRTIDIPSSVTFIADDAFAGCGRLIIVTPAGSFTETWAKGKEGILVANP